MSSTAVNKHPGDPTPGSPADVMNSQTYRIVVNEGRLTWGGAQDWHIVAFHFGTETYWSTNYTSTSIAAPAEWRQVEPVLVQQTQWKTV